MYFIVYRNLNTNHISYIFDDENSDIFFWDIEEEAQEYADESLLFQSGQAVYEIYEAP